MHIKFEKKSFFFVENLVSFLVILNLILLLFFSCWNLKSLIWLKNVQNILQLVGVNHRHVLLFLLIKMTIFNIIVSYLLTYIASKCLQMLSLSLIHIAVGSPIFSFTQFYHHFSISLFLFCFRTWVILKVTSLERTRMEAVYGQQFPVDGLGSMD